MKQKKKVLLVSRQLILRAGLRKAMEKNGEFKVVGEAGQGEAAIRQCHNGNPDLILVDLSVTENNDFDFLLEIKRRWPTVKVVALSFDRSQRLPERALRAWLDGYCHENTGLEDLLQTMQEVFYGRGLVSRNPPDKVWWSTRDKQRFPASLTRRENEIMQLIVQGLTNRQIADALYISDHTVDNHCTNIRTKLGLHSKQALTAYAFRSGLAQ